MRWCRMAILTALVTSPVVAEPWTESDEASRARAESAEAADLAFLAGVWRSDDGDSSAEEVWTAPAGGLLLGVNRTVQAGKRTRWEFLRIAEEEEGGVVFWASPGGVEPTPFRLVGLSDDTATFANPDHDFPQRLVYRREGDTLTVRVEANRDGESAGFELRWRLAADLP